MMLNVTSCSVATPNNHSPANKSDRHRSYVQHNYRQLPLTSLPFLPCGSFCIRCYVCIIQSVADCKETVGVEV